jgi:hypothetical protein
MSYTALTEVDTDGKCPWCDETINDRDDVVACLWSRAYKNVGYNKDNGMDLETITVDMDWNEQNIYHLSCYQEIWQRAKGGPR